MQTQKYNEIRKIGDFKKKERKIQTPKNNKIRKKQGFEEERKERKIQTQKRDQIRKNRD